MERFIEMRIEWRCLKMFGGLEVDSLLSRFCRMEKFVEIRIGKKKVEDLVWNFGSILSWLSIEQEENRESFGNRFSCILNLSNGKIHRNENRMKMFEDIWRFGNRLLTWRLESRRSKILFGILWIDSLLTLSNRKRIVNRLEIDSRVY